MERGEAGERFLVMPSFCNPRTGGCQCVAAQGIAAARERLNGRSLSHDTLTRSASLPASSPSSPARRRWVKRLEDG